MGGGVTHEAFQGSQCRPYQTWRPIEKLVARPWHLPCRAKTWIIFWYSMYCTFTYWLNSMVQSPSWEANWFAASQEIPRISWNPKVHYRTHNRPPPVSILGQPNPVHIPTSHLMEIHPNIIHQSTPRSPQWSLSLRFPHQHPTYPPLLTHTRHMPSPSHSSRFYHPHNVGWGVQIIYLLVMQSPPFPRYLVPPRSKCSPQHHVLKHPQLPFLPQYQRPSFTPIQNNRQNYSFICIVRLDLKIKMAHFLSF